jgi:RimJ/RimL family protein N-acetyltransferase
MARRVEVTRRILEIDDPANLRPPEHPPRVPFDLVEVHDPELNRELYATVGKPYHWVDRLGWRDADWVRWEGRVETRVIEVEGERAGYFELEPGAGRVTLAYFGLYEPFQGVGIGGHALTLALRRGFEIAPIVQVSTNSLDGPHALANYEARGMRERQLFVEHRVIDG